MRHEKPFPTEVSFFKKVLICIGVPFIVLGAFMMKFGMVLCGEGVHTVGYDDEPIL